MPRIPRENRIHACFICGKEADSAHGSCYSLFWLCNKHDREFMTEEKILKQMIEIQALRNIKKRFLCGVVA